VGEWNERGPQQQVEVEQQQRPVDPRGLLEESMMVEPDHADGQKAHQVGDVAGPLRPQGVGEPLIFVDLWGRISMTSRVIAITTTPSLKASSQVLVTFSPSFPCGRSTRLRILGFFDSAR
jgi:hypothetical protein